MNPQKKLDQLETRLLKIIERHNQPPENCNHKGAKMTRQERAQKELEEQEKRSEQYLNKVQEDSKRLFSTVRAREAYTLYCALKEAGMSEENAGFAIHGYLVGKAPDSEVDEEGKEEWRKYQKEFDAINAKRNR